MDTKLVLKQAANDNKNLLTNPTEILNTAMEFQQLLMLYESGIKQINTKFEILEDEFESRHQRNPISTITSRIKEPMSILEKLQRKGLAITLDNMVNRLYDIAGIRVTCPFVSDVYHVSHMLLQQDDITLLEVKDYIKNPKENGYRSLHIIVKVGVYFSDQKREIPVEIQIRTIAMDFWASLEHQLHYKNDADVPDSIRRELFRVAETIAMTDREMEEIALELQALD